MWKAAETEQTKLIIFKKTLLSRGSCKKKIGNGSIQSKIYWTESKLAFSDATRKRTYKALQLTQLQYMAKVLP